MGRLQRSDEGLLHDLGQRGMNPVRPLDECPGGDAERGREDQGAATWPSHDAPDRGQPWIKTTGRPEPPVSSTCTFVDFSSPE
jgi:hypothetical protein